MTTRLTSLTGSCAVALALALTLAGALGCSGNSGSTSTAGSAGAAVLPAGGPGNGAGVGGATTTGGGGGDAAGGGTQSGAGMAGQPGGVGGVPLASAGAPGKLPTAVCPPRSALASVGNPIQGASPLASVKSGLGFGEGPVWIEETGVLYFTDVLNNKILLLEPPAKVIDFLPSPGAADGLAGDFRGNLIACEIGAHRVVKIGIESQSATTLADHYLGTALNSPNDVVVACDGTIYFTDPANTEHRELGFAGVYRLPPSGELALVSKSITFPNGIALSPDEKKLYVAHSGAASLWVLDVPDAGAFGDARKLVDTAPQPDGIAVDDAGNVYVTTETGVQVFEPNGTLWGSIAAAPGDKTTNATFGGADRRTLYVTGASALYETRVQVPGLP